tara:strand:- start:451 stop:672 length:222 start_codon:yes stop_codon:yes gene_type:complete
MKKGDLVKVIKNDMSLVIPSLASSQPKNNFFFGQIGIIIEIYDPAAWEVNNPWYTVLFPAGYYDARRDALELL